MLQIIAQVLLMAVIFAVIGYVIHQLKLFTNPKLKEEIDDFKLMTSKIKEENLSKEQLIKLLSRFVSPKVQLKNKVIEEKLFSNTILSDIEDEERVLAVNVAETARKLEKDTDLEYYLAKSKTNKELCLFIADEIRDINREYKNTDKSFSKEIKLILNSKKRYLKKHSGIDEIEKEKLISTIDDIIKTETSYEKSLKYNLLGNLMDEIKVELDGFQPSEERYEEINSKLNTKYIKHLNQEQIDFAFKALGF